MTGTVVGERGGAGAPVGARAGGGEGGRTYLCIDLKSFYASVECVDRGLDPFTTNLVVADPERSANTICLAITPAMKARGVRNRCRVREIPPGMEYLTAMPRMRRYMEVSAQIVRCYLRFVAPEDVHVYSVDECFIDATPYLGRYGVDARGLAERMRREVMDETGITATAGVGPNMFLCKVALDVCAKHAPDGIAVLDEASFRRDIWFHRPITDIWGIGPGIARRLARLGAFDLAGVCAVDPALLRREFGKDSEWLVDHAWGLEPCTVAQARSYAPRARSLSNGQVLMRDYSFEEGRTVLREMVFGSAQDLAAKGLACGSVGLYVGYSASAMARLALEEAEAARGGRPAGPEDGVPELDAGMLRGGGSRRLGAATSSEHALAEAFLGLYDRTVRRDARIRRVCLWLGGVVPAPMAAGTLFDDVRAQAREARLARCVEGARGRFGPNAVLRMTSLREEANARERNMQVGGHRA